MSFDRAVAASRALAVALVATMVAACGLSPSSGPTVAYREAGSEKSLEVPPDLANPASGSGLSVPGDGSGANSGKLLPQFENVEFVRKGDNSWLEIPQTAPEKIWPRVDSFLRSQGLVIERRAPKLGLMETGWAKRYDSPQASGIAGFVDGLFGGLTSSSLRDKYIIRLERMDNGSGTRVFISHRVAREVNTNLNTIEPGDYEWTQRAGDSAIEAEMARRLLVHLGVSDERSGQVVADAGTGSQPRPNYVVQNDAARIVIGDPDPRRVFARVGDALGRIDAEILQTERERGVYTIDWLPPEEVADDGGFLGLFGGGEREPVKLQVQVFARSGAVRIKAADKGGAPRSGPVHRALLRELAIAMGADPKKVRQAEQADDEDGFFSGGGRREEQRPYQEPTR